MEEEFNKFSDIVNGNGKTLTMKVLGSEALDLLRSFLQHVDNRIDTIDTECKAVVEAVKGVATDNTTAISNLNDTLQSTIDCNKTLTDNAIDGIKVSLQHCTSTVAKSKQASKDAVTKVEKFETKYNTSKQKISDDLNTIKQTLTTTKSQVTGLTKNPPVWANVAAGTATNIPELQQETRVAKAAAAAEAKKIAERKQGLAGNSHTVYLRPRDKSAPVDKDDIMKKINTAICQGSAHAITFTKKNNLRVHFKNQEHAKASSIGEWIPALGNEYSILDTRCWHIAVVHGVLKSYSMPELRTNIQASNGVILIRDPAPLCKSTTENDAKPTHSVKVFFREEEDCLKALNSISVGGTLKSARKWNPKPRDPPDQNQRRLSPSMVLQEKPSSPSSPVEEPDPVPSAEISDPVSSTAEDNNDSAAVPDKTPSANVENNHSAEQPSSAAEDLNAPLETLC